MRNITDYLEKAAEFERLANQANTEAARKRYADVAACYRLLAAERQQMISEGMIRAEFE
jgi:hypothetical protein